MDVLRLSSCHTLQCTLQDTEERTLHTFLPSGWCHVKVSQCRARQERHCRRKRLPAGSRGLEGQHQAQIALPLRARMVTLSAVLSAQTPTPPTTACLRPGSSLCDLPTPEATDPSTPRGALLFARQAQTRPACLTLGMSAILVEPHLLQQSLNPTTSAFRKGSLSPSVTVLACDNHSFIQATSPAEPTMWFPSREGTQTATHRP